MERKYTLKEQEEIGLKIAEILQLRKNRPYGFKTNWGAKTPIGVFATILQLANDIKTGKEI